MTLDRYPSDADSRFFSLSLRSSPLQLPQPQRVLPRTRQDLPEERSCNNDTPPLKLERRRTLHQKAPPRVHGWSRRTRRPVGRTLCLESHGPTARRKKVKNEAQVKHVLCAPTVSRFSKCQTCSLGKAAGHKRHDYESGGKSFARVRHSWRWNTSNCAHASFVFGTDDPPTRVRWLSVNSVRRNEPQRAVGACVELGSQVATC